MTDSHAVEASSHRLRSCNRDVAAMSDASVVSFATTGAAKAFCAAYAAQMALRTVPTAVRTLIHCVRRLAQLRHASAALRLVVKELAVFLRRVSAAFAASQSQLRFASFLGSVVLFTRLVVGRARRHHGLAVMRDTAQRLHGSCSHTPAATLPCNEARRAGMLVGMAAAASLFLVPADARVGVTLFVGVRAAEVAIRHLHRVGMLPSCSYPFSLLMIVASAELPYSGVFAPNALDPSTCAV